MEMTVGSGKCTCASVAMSNTDLAAAAHTLSEWDMAPVRHVLEKDGMTASEASVLTEEYRKFLLVILKNPTKRFGISKIVDEAWHAHILQTEDYANMCNSVFGRFLHHNPNISGEAATPFYKEMVQCLLAEFGEADKRYWSQAAAGLCHGGSCSAHCDSSGPIN